ncbi:uncharacterized protein [Triticum aestivum]|uniref:uncharacterized protein n=1 Tax=Triticum aestivum TaxID=4565 RepID=UPI001D018A70|nr:uncharacterized protein LOC123188343 [Triticum aestivum]XP_044456330.1 uncharacterized protein LOC123188343 [Triticum aestivum]XP_044456331.1 uncharacterized protein LOC123188343 [Triticum aestivum]XP_044456332.1 uncharacterized protein LOC123188343 [Triticum aestivum]XP_044456333.1 uncharacterized protein LOC123188343 [Triticum aestivum]XP_044456334.1 uncharacterized protein LOC123188343 [Triticum aestivum]XP_044456335.1 uncharacterized protein LOC123188343 [Triticum aestivum]XP_04445633
MGPPGSFVEGASGPGLRPRGGFRGHRGGRGGRGGRYRPRPHTTSVIDPMVVDGAVEQQVLTGQALEVVSALANAEIPGNESGLTVSVEDSSRAESERASKYARKKEKMLCYRCGGKGHFIAECVAELCGTCVKPAHDSGDCPFLRDQAPSLMMHGVYCAELTFFESPTEMEVPDETLSLTTGLVKIARGEVLEAQIIQRLKELAPGDFRWELASVEDKLFLVEFPSVEELQRLLSFGMCKVPGTDGMLEFHEWKRIEPTGKPLTQVWLRFSGAPSKLMRDARVVASLGIMVGRPERMDMDFTRAHGIARLLVSVLNIEYVPEVVKWAYRGHIYNLVIEFEDESLFAEAANGSDTDMHEDDDSSALKEAPTADSGRELSTPQGADSHTSVDVTAPPSTVPTTILRFSSFEPASAPPRLWSDRVESDEVFEHSLPVLELEEPVIPLLGELSISVRAEAEEVVLVGEGLKLVTSDSSPLVAISQVQPMVPAADGGVGQVASVPSSGPAVGELPMVQIDSLGGRPRLLDPAPSSPFTGPATLAPESLLGEDSGKVASGSSSLVEPKGACSPMPLVPPVGPWAGVDGELGQEALAPPSPGLGHSSRASREEVISFGGIPDPVSEGQRLSSCFQDHPKVDDIQQRCAMRAAKLHDVEVTTGFISGYCANPYVVLTHSDGGQGAFGYWICPVGDGSTGYLQPV